MFVIALIVVGVIAVALAVTAVLLTRQSSRLRDELQTAQTSLAAARGVRSQLDNALAQFDALRREHDTALTQISQAQGEEQKKVEWLDNQEKEIEWLRGELEKRPKIVRRTYKILTLGISGTGKTALTLKWSNPLIDLGTLQGTKIERYERTVSHVAGKEVTIEHVFEVGDWGGEHIVDAQQELIVDEIHGLLIVVDLAPKEGKAVDPGRVQQQLREFQPEALKFFFGPKTIASCKTVVLFINKADVLSGTPAEVEREARNIYKKLIDDLEKYKAHLDVRVLVGSATYGHSTHHLFSHFVERILPKNAYDSQLLQRMKQDAAAADRPPPQFPPAAAPATAPLPRALPPMPPMARPHVPRT